MQKSEGKLGHGRKGLRIKPGVTPECNSFHSSMSWRLEDYHKVMSEEDYRWLQLAYPEAYCWVNRGTGITSSIWTHPSPPVPPPSLPLPLPHPRPQR